MPSFIFNQSILLSFNDVTLFFYSRYSFNPIANTSHVTRKHTPEQEEDDEKKTYFWHWK